MSAGYSVDFSTALFSSDQDYAPLSIMCNNDHNEVIIIHHKECCFRCLCIIGTVISCVTLAILCTSCKRIMIVAGTDKKTEL